MMWRRRSVLALSIALATGSACSAAVPEAAPTPRSTQEGASTTSVSAPDCVVSELLVPSCGIWFGASTPSGDGTFDYERGLVEYEEHAANTPDILRFYMRGSAPFPDQTQQRLAERPGQQKSLLFISWKPDPEMTWREIADGGADAAIRSVANGLRTYPDKLFLAIHHEPENDVIDRFGSGMTTGDYVDMYRHVVELLRSERVVNVVYVMNYMGFDRWASMVDELYPGDDVVDWIAYDPYGLSRHSSFADMLNEPNGPGWNGFYSWAESKAPAKPLMVGEWGMDPDIQERATEMLAQAPQTLQEEFPKIKAVVYWNSQGKRINASLRTDTDAAANYTAIYRRIADDPYFNLTLTEAGR